MRKKATYGLGHPLVTPLASPGPVTNERIAALQQEFMSRLKTQEERIDELRQRKESSPHIDNEPKRPVREKTEETESPIKSKPFAIRSMPRVVIDPKMYGVEAPPPPTLFKGRALTDIISQPASPKTRSVIEQFKEDLDALSFKMEPRWPRRLYTEQESHPEIERDIY